MTAPVLGLIDLSHPFNAVGEELPLLCSATGPVSFLDIFLSQCSHVKGIDVFHIVVRKSSMEKYVAHIGRVSLPGKVHIIPIPDSEHGYFYDGHAMFLKARKWCHQTIRGGVGDMTIFDEILPMALIKQIASSSKVGGVLHLHPSFPMFDPEYASQLVQTAGQESAHGVPLMLFRQATLGLCPAFVTWPGLEALNNGINWSPAQVMRGDSIGDGVANMNNIVRHNLDCDMMRGNFTLNAQRDCARLSKVLHFLMAEDRDVSAKDCSEVLFGHPEILSESFPREVEIETYDDTGLCMPPLLFNHIYQQCCNVGDCRVSIQASAFYHDLMLKEVIKKKPYGLNIVLTYGMVVGYPSLCKEWAEAKPDMITVKLHPLSEDISDFKPHLEGLAIGAKANGVLLHVELIKDDRNWRAIHQLHQWHQEMGFGYNWVPAQPEIMPYVPMERGDCEKIMYQMNILADGRVVPCRRCTNHLLGDTNRHKLSEIWESFSGLRQERFSYLQKFSACKECAEWLST
jgi:radical SAM protein with 4Fe4S-binding SPASM domain